MASIKNEAADKAAKMAGVTRTQARQVVNDFLTEVINAIAKGRWVDIRGFGTFRATVAERAYDSPAGRATRCAVRVAYRPTAIVRNAVEEQWNLDRQINASSTSTNGNSSQSETPPPTPSAPTHANLATSLSGSKDEAAPSAEPAATT